MTVSDRIRGAWENLLDRTETHSTESAAARPSSSCAAALQSPRRERRQARAGRGRLHGPQLVRRVPSRRPQGGVLMTTKTYNGVRFERGLDGGYSGSLTVTAAAGTAGYTEGPMFVFVDIDLPDPTPSLVLTAEQARALGEALTTASEEGLPSGVWDLAAFRNTFGHDAPAEHTRTSADLRRHVRALSDQHEATLDPAFKADRAEGIRRTLHNAGMCGDGWSCSACEGDDD